MKYPFPGQRKSISESAEMKYSWVAQLHPSHPSCCHTICNNSAKKTIESKSTKSTKSTRKLIKKETPRGRKDTMIWKTFGRMYAQEMYRFWRKSFERTPCSWVAQLHPLHSSCCLTIYNNDAKKAIESRSKSKKSTRKPLEKRQQREERKPRY